MAYNGPSGLMGKPEHPEECVCFQDGDIEIYLSRDVFDKLAPETEKLLFAVQDYGRFWLWFDRTAKIPTRKRRTTTWPS
jgi:hypothetical protein